MSESMMSRVGKQFPVNLGEIFHRSPEGRIMPRSGFVDDLICRIGITYVQQTTVNLDPAPIIEAIKTLSDDARLQTLMDGYKTLVFHYEDYCDTKDPSYLQDINLQAKNSVPGFAGALRNQLDVIKPEEWFQIEKKFRLLYTLCDTYIKVFALHFFARTTLHPQTKSNVYRLQPQIHEAIEMLRCKLQDTLLPNGSSDNSVLLEAFLMKDSDLFEYYAHYDGRYCSIQGTQRFVMLANSNSPRHSNILIEKPVPGIEHKNFANRLIQLIEKFETLSRVTSFIETADEESMLPLLLADLSRPLQ